MGSDFLGCRAAVPDRRAGCGVNGPLVRLELTTWLVDKDMTNLSMVS